MITKIWNIVKYNNALPIAISIIVASSGVAFAATNDTVRGQFISEKTTVRSVDNSFILNTNLKAFNPKLQIVAISEDKQFYYVAYKYDTIAITDYVWGEKTVNGTLSVSKVVLGKQDLGVYVAEQLRQDVDSKMAYLNRVQKIEKTHGKTEKIATVAYSGLIGKFLSTKTETFSNYKPVKVDKKAELANAEEAKNSAKAAVANAVSSQIASVIPTKAEVRQIIENKVAELVAQEKVNPTTNQTPVINLQSVTGSSSQSSGQNNTPAASPDNSTASTSPAAVVASTTLATSTPTEQNSSGTASTSPKVLQDTTPPVITITKGTDSLTVGDTFVDAGATATDDVDGNVSSKIKTSSTVDTTKAGTYGVTYTVSDAADNTASSTRPVTVVAKPVSDTTPPVITITKGTDSLTVGDTFVDAGATATDDVDGNVSSKIKTSSTVDTTKAGTYGVTYTVSDAADNTASSTRPVTVVASTTQATSTPQ